ncbi:MAG: hypothetical protein N3A69_09610, partial [Leptospiraceae bacterium]|nr:hypothetical protein [Leptospiraceae bacterium]
MCIRDSLCTPPPLEDSAQNPYAISIKDAEDILYLLESAKESEIFEKENLEKITKNFSKFFYAPRLTPNELIEDSEDIDLGIPPKDRSLTKEQKKKRLEEEILQTKYFHTQARSFIYDATPDELRNMRTNLTLAIAMFAELEDYLKANSEIEWEYFQTVLECNQQTRMLVIDAMLAKEVSP